MDNCCNSILSNMLLLKSISWKNVSVSIYLISTNNDSSSKSSIKLHEATFDCVCFPLVAALRLCRNIQGSAVLDNSCISCLLHLGQQETFSKSQYLHCVERIKWQTRQPGSVQAASSCRNHTPRLHRSSSEGFKFLILTSDLHFTLLRGDGSCLKTWQPWPYSKLLFMVTCITPPVNQHWRY